ncbi:MAG: Mannitol dehydrogenase domain [Marmoricola sp.]|nr:Mannitol dehydrogenase domain [Marmoricola sp.]
MTCAPPGSLTVPQAASVEWRGYDRSALTLGIVHFGVGAFHRAHFAEYIDDALAAGETGWAICGVGLLPEDRAILDSLRNQGCIYTRTVKHADGTWSPRLIGSIIEVLSAPDDPSVVLDRLDNPTVRIVSMTITEGGYLIDEQTGEFDTAANSIQDDLDGMSSPTTIFGYLVTALARRREAGIEPFTVLSCDNLPGNGDAIRKGVLAVAAYRDPDLAAWISANVAFPNSMVDRITPGTSDADRERLREEFEIVDNAAVVCEPFKQWVLEDEFTSGRPSLDHYGAQFVADVGPFEGAKLRMLNGGHQAIAQLGYLGGHEFVHQACTDPILINFLLAYLAEVQVTLSEQVDLDLDRYGRQLIARFSNPEIADPVDRIRAYASDRIPKWVVPPLCENLAAGRDPVFGALVLVAWRRAIQLRHSLPIAEAAPDRIGDRLAMLADDGDPIVFLGERDLFGRLADDAAFAGGFGRLAAGFEAFGAPPEVLRILYKELFGGPISVGA